METNRFNHYQTRPASTTHHKPVRAAAPIGDVRIPVQRPATLPGSAPATILPPAHHQPPHNAVNQPVQHAVAAETEPPTTVSIKLRIPAFKWPRVPPVIADYAGFWWLSAVTAVVLVMIGFYIGQHAAFGSGKSASPDVTYSTPNKELRVS